MRNNKPDKNPQIMEDDIDIVSFALKMWEKRSFIIKATCCFFILGLFVKYTLYNIMLVINPKL